MAEDKQSEIHLLITWERANLSPEMVISRFPYSLELINHFKYTWDPNYAEQNFAAFYGQNLDRIDYKVNHCGKGSFDVYLVCDSNPVYEIRQTTSGNKKVNINLFDLKTNLRKLTGGGHLVHGTDSPDECKMNIASLFGMSVEQVVSLNKNHKGEVITISRNVSGVPYWKSWEEMFSLLNLCTEYVVLRNSKTVLENNHDLHGDTDILVRDRNIADVVLSGNRVFEDKKRVLYKTQFISGPQLVDVRYVGDGYYSRKWEDEILDSRVANVNGWLYVPNAIDSKYTLLYHALVHKPQIASDYKESIQKLFNTADRDELTKVLKEFLKEMGYGFSVPIDPSVYINPQFFDVLHVSVKYQIRNAIIKFMNESDESNGKRRDKTVYKILYKGYRVAHFALGKISKIVKKIWNLIRKAI